MKLLAIITVLFCQVALAAPIELQSLVDSDGNKKVFTVDSDKLIGIPAWNPKIKEPPLPISEAVNLAEKAILSNAPSSHCELAGISLAKVPYGAGKNTWYYYIQLMVTEKGIDPTIPSDPLSFSYETVIVLMDGTIIK